ncbi:MAG: PAS domain S-box protein [Candidatus Eremiobacterota bacterium]
MKYEQMSRDELLEELESLSSIVKPFKTDKNLKESIRELQVHHDELEKQNRELGEKLRELQESRDRYAILYDFAPVGYCRLDKKGVIKDINLTGANILGLKRDSLIDMPFNLFISECDRDKFLSHLKTFDTQSDKNSTELRLRDKNGVRIELLSSPLEGPEELMFQTIITDITDRRQLEENLHIALEKYKVLFESFPLGISITDKNGKIIDTNKESERLLGMSYDDHTVRKYNSPDWQIVRTDGTLMPAEEYASVRAMKENHLVENIEMGIVKDNGNITWISVTAAPIPIEQYGVAIAYGDITGRILAEKALRESEEKLQAIFNIANIGIAITDTTGRYVMFNNWWIEILGYDREEMRNFTNLDITYPDDKETSRAWFLKIVQGKIENYRLEKRFVKKDNSVFWGDLSVSSIKDKDNNVTNVVGIVTDITERKQADEALKKEHCQTQMYLDIAGVMLLVLDREGCITRINKKGCSILGYTEQELTGRNWFDTCLPEGIKEDVRGVFQQLVNGDISPVEYYENPVLTKSGEECIIAFHNAFLRDSSGKITDILSSGEDITDRKLKEKALEEAERNFRSMVETLPIAIHLSTGIEQKCEYLNPAFIKWFGYTMDDIPTGAEWFNLAYPDEEYRRELLEEWSGKIAHAMETNSTVGPLKEVMVTCKDGSKKYISWGYITLGEKNYSCGLDVTERRQAEEEKEKLQKQLLHAQKMESVGRMVGGVAHNFNNILGIIIGCSEVIMMDLEPDNPLYSQLQLIVNSSQRAANLVRQLMAFARKQTVTPKVLDINKTLSAMHKMLCQLIGEHIELIWTPCLDLWKVRIDPNQLDQIVVNLTVNSRDAMHNNGSITLKTDNAVFDTSYFAGNEAIIPGDYVLLSVSDTGVGMSKEILENIFEPFYTTKGVGKGTGLGLPTVYGIVHQNNGFVNVFSEEGKGTTIKIYLPRFKSEPLMAPAEKEPDKLQAGTETILIAEDEEGYLVPCKMLLEKLGYTVLTATTPAQAIYLAEKHSKNIDLLITDVVMPGMNGRELMEKIHTIRPGMKCIYMSGYPADVIASHGVMDEAFLEKPFSRKTVAAKVREVLDSK